MWRDGDYKPFCFGGKQEHKENPLRHWSEWWEPGARARLGVVGGCRRMSSGTGPF